MPINPKDLNTQRLYVVCLQPAFIALAEKYSDRFDSVVYVVNARVLFGVNRFSAKILFAPGSELRADIPELKAIAMQRQLPVYIHEG